MHFSACKLAKSEGMKRQPGNLAHQSDPYRLPSNGAGLSRATLLYRRLRDCLATAQMSNERASPPRDVLDSNAEKSTFLIFDHAGSPFGIQLSSGAFPFFQCSGGKP